MTNANESALEDDFLLVHAYLDGELDPADALVVGRKIAANPALSAELECIKALRQTVSELPRRTLPPHLRSRIDAAFGSKRQPARSSWQALAASTLLAFMLGGGSTWLVLHPVASERTAEAVVDSHMRGLMASRPTDVASSEALVQWPHPPGTPRRRPCARWISVGWRARGCHRQHSGPHTRVWAPPTCDQPLGHPGSWASRPG
jgi:anti-sigma factor RsiW